MKQMFLNSRNALVLFICFILTLPACGKNEKPPLRRGLFVSVIQEPQVLSSQKAIKDLVKFAKKARIKILFVQIYRANKAWFPSNVGDPSPYYECLEKVKEDPFRLLIKQAHAAGIEVHAWLNLLSLGDNPNAKILKKYGAKILTRNIEEKKKLEDYKIDNQYFLEPGDPNVRRELSIMVGEVLGAYPEMDGMQFDYIRYPDWHPAYGHTEANVKRFKRVTGLKQISEKSEVWKAWKRAQVTSLLRRLVRKTRRLSPEMKVSTTGLMSFFRAYHEGFQDWRLWLQSGMIDFVTPMNYLVDNARFERNIIDAKNRTWQLFNRVNIGIGAYELVDAPEKFVKQFEFCEKVVEGDCVIFHYGSLVENPALRAPLLKNKPVINSKN